LWLTPEAKAQLAEQGYGPVFGARPLKRTVQRMTENPLAVEVLGGRLQEGDHIVVEPNGETFTFHEEAPAATAS
jgi:ATP-dependent Clp protease ATP-binding subunit ClpB